MAVIINEFEIEASSPHDNNASQTAEAGQANAQAQPLSPHDVQELLRRQHLRLLRLLAH